MKRKPKRSLTRDNSIRASQKETGETILGREEQKKFPNSVLLTFQINSIGFSRMHKN